jgi:2'-hydroxyisoflavone reductase
VGALTVLVLGGTGFVGREIVATLLAGGHRTTVFNRGRHRIFPAAGQLVGDREAGDHAALRTGEWDAVVDVTGYLPADVAGSMDALGDRAGRYLFISSHVVLDGAGPGLRPAIRDAVPPLTDETYGPSKVACEQDVVARYGDRATIVRPVKVAGPHDNQNGLTYWVRRAARGGRVAVPGDPDRPVQLVDVRDVAGLVAGLLTAGRGGAFTAAGPSTTLAGLLAVCAEVAGTEVEPVAVPPVEGFPLVKPAGMDVTPHRVPAPEMTVTPLPVTVRDVLDWDRKRGEPPLGCGFTPAEEAAALARVARAGRPGPG